MGAAENKQATQEAYTAFGNADAEGAMKNIDDSIVWTVNGNNSLTGQHQGKQAVGELWLQLMTKGFATAPHDFVADGDKVIVLTTTSLDGDSLENADVLKFNEAGKLVSFESLGDPGVLDRVFPR